LAGVVRKKLKLKLNSMKVEVDGHRLYCIDPVFPRITYTIFRTFRIDGFF
jgi:hypothetical protein